MRLSSSISNSSPDFPETFADGTNLGEDGLFSSVWAFKVSNAARGAVTSYSAQTFAIGYVLLGQFKDTTVTIRNKGNDTLKITGISSFGNGITARPVVMSISPNGSTIDTLRFAPTILGPVSGSIIVASKAPTSPDSIKVTASGVTASMQVMKDAAIPQVYSLSQSIQSQYHN